MEFTVSITARKSVSISSNELNTALIDSLDGELQGSGLENVNITENDDVEVEVEFTGDLSVELDSDKLVEFVRDQATDELNDADIRDFDIDEVTEN